MVTVTAQIIHNHWFPPTHLVPVLDPNLSESEGDTESTGTDLEADPSYNWDMCLVSFVLDFAVVFCCLFLFFVHADQCTYLHSGTCTRVW